MLQWLRDGLLLLLVFVAIELIADEHKSTGTRISFPHGTPTLYRPRLNRFCCLNLSQIKKYGLFECCYVTEQSVSGIGVAIGNECTRTPRAEKKIRVIYRENL